MGIFSLALCIFLLHKIVLQFCVFPYLLAPCVASSVLFGIAPGLWHENLIADKLT
jgi:hypothetical protein